MKRTLQDEIADVRQAQSNGDIGRARTCARRAIGMALRQTVGIGPGEQNYAKNFIEGVWKLTSDPNYPEEVRDAAARLGDRSLKDRTSASSDPVKDLEIIMTLAPALFP